LEEDEKAEDPEGEREQSKEKDGVEEEALVYWCSASWLCTTVEKASHRHKNSKNNANVHPK
jgi:hypothetical protein